MSRHAILCLCRVLLVSLSCWPGGSWADPFKLDWEASVTPGVASYQVYWGPTPSGPWSLMGTVAAPSPTLSGTITQTTSFYATALLPTGRESDPSNIVTKTVATPPPASGDSALVIGVLTSATGAVVTLQGTATALRFFYDAEPTPAVIPNATDSGTYTHSFVWPQGTTFACYQAKGADNVWTEQGCNSVTPGPPPPPAPPNHLRITQADSNKVVIQFDWNPTLKAPTYCSEVKNLRSYVPGSNLKLKQITVTCVP